MKSTVGRLQLVLLLLFIGLLTACNSAPPPPPPAVTPPTRVESPAGGGTVPLAPVDQPKAPPTLDEQLHAAQSRELPGARNLPPRTIYTDIAGDTVITLEDNKDVTLLTYRYKGEVKWKQSLPLRSPLWVVSPAGKWVLVTSGDQAVLVDETGQVAWQWAVPAGLNIGDPVFLAKGTQALIPYFAADRSHRMDATVLDLTVKPVKASALPTAYDPGYGTSMQSEFIAVLGYSTAAIYHGGMKQYDVTAAGDFLGFSDEANLAAFLKDNSKLQVLTATGQPVFTTDLETKSDVTMAPAGPVFWGLSRKPADGQYRLVIYDGKGTLIGQFKLGADLSPRLVGVSRDGTLGFLGIHSGAGNLDCVIRPNGQLQGCYPGFDVSHDGLFVVTGDAQAKIYVPIANFAK